MGSRSFRIEWYLKSIMKLQFYELLHLSLMLVKDYEKTLMKIIKILTPTVIFPWVNNLPFMPITIYEQHNQISYLALSFTVTIRKITMGFKVISNRIHFYYSFDFMICQIHMY